MINYKNLKFLEKCELREVLLYAIKCGVRPQDLDKKSLEATKELWKTSIEYERYQYNLEHGIFPDLVTAIPDFLPVSKKNVGYCAVDHDIRYIFGGNKHDRKLADILFRLCIFELLDKTNYARFVSWTYYIFVRLFGWKNYNFH